MYGDTEVMRKHALRLREQGERIRALADRVVARTDAVGWAGRAGDTVRTTSRERAARLREAAARHEAAASSLEAHLQHTERLKESIAEAERRARALLDDGHLAGLEQPVPGHKDWLAVPLPPAPGSSERSA